MIEGVSVPGTKSDLGSISEVKSPTLKGPGGRSLAGLDASASSGVRWLPYGAQTRPREEQAFRDAPRYGPLRGADSRGDSPEWARIGSEAGSDGGVASSATRADGLDPSSAYIHTDFGDTPVCDDEAMLGGSFRRIETTAVWEKINGSYSEDMVEDDHVQSRSELDGRFAEWTFPGEFDEAGKGETRFELHFGEAEASELGNMVRDAVVDFLASADDTVAQAADHAWRQVKDLSGERSSLDLLFGSVQATEVYKSEIVTALAYSVAGDRSFVRYVVGLGCSLYLAAHGVPYPLARFVGNEIARLLIDVRTSAERNREQLASLVAAFIRALL